MLWVWISFRVRCTTLCDKVCQWLATDLWFSQVPRVNWTPRCNWNIVESGVKHHQTNKYIFVVNNMRLHKGDIVHFRLISVLRNLVSNYKSRLTKLVFRVLYHLRCFWNKRCNSAQMFSDFSMFSHSRLS
jgi:hypothetical protein